MAIEYTIVYEGSLACQLTHGPSGIVVHTDAPRDNGGQGRFFSPTDLLAASLGACMLTIIGMRAKARNWDIDGSSATVIKHMVSDPLRRVSALDVSLQVKNQQVLTRDERQMLETAAASCPVAESLSDKTEVRLEIEFAL